MWKGEPGGEIEKAKGNGPHELAPYLQRMRKRDTRPKTLTRRGKVHGNSEFASRNSISRKWAAATKEGDSIFQQILTKVGNKAS